MPLRIDLDKTYLTSALEDKIKSLQRARNAKKLNPAMDLLYEKDIAIYTIAMNTIADK